MVKILKQSDSMVNQIVEALKSFEQAHPHAECTVYRYNPASIRIRIVDTVFAGRSKGERHDYAMSFLRDLPEDTISEISILLCVVPGETSLIDLEFNDPSRSQL